MFGEIALELGLVDDEAIHPSPRRKTVAVERRSTVQEDYCAEVHHVVHVSTDIERRCEFCSEPIGGDRFPDSINHYIREHGYRLLHVGTETADTDGGLWHSTVAVLGR